MFIEDFDKMVEELEANEDMVECKECFELFPKKDCFHFPGGYLCQGCHVPEQEMPKYKTLSKAEDTSRDTTLNLFNHEFPDIMEYNPDSVAVQEPQEFPELDDLADLEPEVIDDPADALEFLIKDEYDAIEGYELADEVIQHSSLDAELKGKILDTLAHIQEEEEEHIDELKALTLPKPQEPEDVEIIEPTDEVTASTHVLNEDGFEPVLDSEDTKDSEEPENPEDSADEEPKENEVLTEAPKFIDAIRNHGKEAVSAAGGFWKALRHPIKTGKLALLAEPLDKVFDGYKIVKFMPGSNSKIDTSFRPPVSSFPSFLKALQAIETIAKADAGSTYVLCVDTDPAKMTLVDGSTASQIKASPQLVVYRGGREDPSIGRAGLTRVIALLERDAKLKKLFGATVDTEEEEPEEAEAETETPPTPSEDPKARVQALRDAKRRLIEFNSFLKEVQKLKNPTGELRAAVREFLKAYADAKAIILDPASTADDLSLDLGDLADNIDILDSYYDGDKTIIRDALGGGASPEPEAEPEAEAETPETPETPETEAEPETPAEPAITPKEKNHKVNRQIKGALKAAGIPDEILKQLKDTNMANLRKTLKQLLGESFKQEDLDRIFEDLEATTSDN